MPWNTLYDNYGQAPLDAVAMEERVKVLMVDEEVQKKSGIYTYVLTGDEHALGLRTFTDNQKPDACERQAVSVG